MSTPQDTPTRTAPGDLPAPGLPPVPAVTLAHGTAGGARPVAMPQLGFGVFQVPDDETAAAVTAALDAGYRSIDTAAVYGNEAGVGRALAASGLARDELFVTTKLWNADQGYDSTLRAFDTSLERVGLDLVDLYLIHWPAPAGDRYLDTWRALRTLLAGGRVRAIGVSNFQPAHLRRLVEDGGVVPAVNQVELHPGLQQRELRAVHAEFGITTEAWSPLAQGALLGEPALAAIARRHGRTPAQVVLRWHLQLGTVVIPKSVTPARVRENIDVFGFALDDADMAAIAALDRGLRTGPDPDVFN
ncbi:Aldo/keto reductase [Actinacidiphila rubida]|uniref:Aldo/keto reductase n=3 Tax=Actinacidiphila rubida TaxID=310780 RepID=A0A1H8LNX4_9ACTN|nr:Aldo/keto reductase [Actinacidiphila rubida]